MRLAGVLLALSAGILAGPALSAPEAGTAPPDPVATVGLRILDAPTDRADDPRARKYIVDHLAPGATITRRVEVINSTPTVQAVDVYPAAAIVDEGGFQPVEGRAINELSSWTSVDTATVSPAAGESSVVTVTIAVPGDAAPGERYAAIWAQLPTAVATNGGMSTVNRVGIRIYLSVGEGNEPASDFTIESFEASRDLAGTPSVAAVVHNTGGRALDLAGEMTLSNGPGGISAGPFAATLGTTIQVGASAPAVVVLDEDIPAGTWDAHITLQSGLLAREADAQIVIPSVADAASPPVAPVQADDSGTRLLPAIIAALVLLLIATGILLRRRRRARRTRSSIPGAHDDVGSSGRITEPVQGRRR